MWRRKRYILQRFLYLAREMVFRTLVLMVTGNQRPRSLRRSSAATRAKNSKVGPNLLFSSPTIATPRIFFRLLSADYKENILVKRVNISWYKAKSCSNIYFNWPAFIETFCCFYLTIEFLNDQYFLFLVILASNFYVFDNNLFLISMEDFHGKV